MLYRPYDGFGIDNTTLVHAMHDLVLSIVMAKRAGNQAAANALYQQFIQVADEYRANGGNEAWLARLINHVHDAVVATGKEVLDTTEKVVEDVASAAGKTVHNVVAPLVPDVKALTLPLMLIAAAAAAVIFAPTLLGQLGKKRRA